ncbi:lactoylglutathione lyase [Consotaella salsifontis]|uniref:Lactoylglutathione lyase n=1 Tax=Consotaella salsifontis TaxID=1365950 RepID=A0A1T4S2T4_9HYPH|nr:lactoylglutathione lyase [Consotaella salsifontis]SKA22545.1 lactoylglutathione lyase [Consotaella salsifontis]
MAADPATRDFVFNHTMIRVCDARASLDFYTRILGFALIEHQDFSEAGFSLYFLALGVDVEAMPADEAERSRWRKSIPGVLELTHNHGTEEQAEFRYHDGNAEPRGFGHICLSVPDVVAACERFEALGVTFQKRLTDGRMKGIAFVRDPDGYWIEIIQPTPLAG